MVRSVIAEESLLSYIENLSKTECCTIGLILGQPTLTKDYVIHFARTPQPAKRNVSEESLTNIDSSDRNSASSDESERKDKMVNFSDIPESWVGDHAKHATRMLPGGMYILGIFIVSLEVLFNTHLMKIRTILSHMNKNLGYNSYLYGNCDIVTEKLVLIYNPQKGTFACKSIDYKTGGQKQIDFKFMPKSTNWHQLDCNYHFDQIIPITNDKIDWNLKKHLQGILKHVEDKLNKSVIIIDSEIKNENDSIESLGKKKQIRNKSSGRDNDNSKNLQVNIFIPCDDVQNDEPVIFPCLGNMHFVGQLAARVFLHQKATIQEATKAIKEDIIRSLAARLEMHWDSLIEEEVMSPEEKYSVHEPPRRVLIPLPTIKIALSDYLFPGEGPSEALISLQELLDLSVNENDVIKDVEIQAETGDFCPIEETKDKTTGSNVLLATSDTNKLIYTCGLIVAVFVLVVSLIIPYMRQLQ